MSETGGPWTYLLRRLIWLFCGVTLTIFLVGVWLTSDNGPSLDEQIRQARELGYSQDEIRDMSNTLRAQFVVNQQQPGFPFGLTLVGLVPAGIGIAYLLVYRIAVGQRRQERCCSYTTAGLLLAAATTSAPRRATQQLRSRCS